MLINMQRKPNFGQQFLFGKTEGILSLANYYNIELFI